MTCWIWKPIVSTCASPSDRSPQATCRWRPASCIAPALLIAASLLAALLPPEFQLVLGCYYVLTVGYSLGVKGMVMVDTTALAGLYTIRIIAGAAAAGIALSFWLLLFSVFFFLSLAFVKRYAELDALKRRQQVRPRPRLPRRGSAHAQGLGIAAGYMSVLVLALYINSPDISSLYRQPHFIWPLCGLLLYWISRIWMKPTAAGCTMTR